MSNRKLTSSRPKGQVLSARITWAAAGFGLVAVASLGFLAFVMLGEPSAELTAIRIEAARPLPGQPFAVVVILRNAGRASAVRYVQTSELGLTDTPMDEAFINGHFRALYTALAHETGLAGAEVPSGGELRLVSEEARFAPDVAKGIMDGASTVYMIGLVKYKDRSLAEDRWRYTELCLWRHKDGVFRFCGERNNVFYRGS